jgi:hypothetical protein
VEKISTWSPSAPSPTPWPSNAFPIPATIAATLPGVLYGLLSLYEKFARPHQSAPLHMPIRTMLLAQLIIYVPLIAYLLFVVPRLAHRSFAELGIRRPTLRDIKTGLLGTCAMWAIVALSSAILTAITHEHNTETAVQLLRELRAPTDVFIFVAIAVLLAPMIEEFAFRVFLFNAISRHTSVAVGVLGSSVLFGLVHDASNVSVAVPLALGGIVLALVYARTGCYWANVITHASFNAVSVVAVLAFHVTD